MATSCRVTAKARSRSLPLIIGSASIALSTYASFSRATAASGARGALGQKMSEGCCMAFLGGGTGFKPKNKGKPTLHYFSIAGRGELIRFIAAAGGLEIAESNPSEPQGADFKAFSRNNNGFGSLPVMTHGSLKLSQSIAIERYFANIAPKFKSLTVEQRAVDDMWLGHKEDVIQGAAKFVFGKEQTKESFHETMDKYMPLIEGWLPESGFINGLAFPTCADLCILFMTDCWMPLGLACARGGYDLSKYPKMRALADRTRAAPGVKEYVANSKSMTAGPPA